LHPEHQNRPHGALQRRTLPAAFGVVRHNQGRNDEAIRWYRAALEHDPDHAQARMYLADILEDSDRDTT
jgi:Flp pilus assembly protein TadD